MKKPLTETEAKFVKAQERGIASRIEAMVVRGFAPDRIAKVLGVTPRYVSNVLLAMERRKQK